MRALKARQVSAGLPPESEAHFQRSVVKLLRLNGWRVHWTWTSIHSPSGWPDIFAVRGDRALALELKSAHGRLSQAQRAWLATLAGVPSIEAMVIRPADWDVVCEVAR